MALARPPGLSSQSVLPIGHTAHRHRTQHIFQYTIFIVYMSHGSKLKLKVHTVNHQDVVPNVSEVEKSGKVVDAQECCTRCTSTRCCPWCTSTRCTCTRCCAQCLRSREEWQGRSRRDAALLYSARPAAVRSQEFPLLPLKKEKCSFLRYISTSFRPSSVTNVEHYGECEQ